MKPPVLPVLSKRILYFGKSRELVCDGQCDQVWGKSWQGPKNPPAPEDPGTSEGFDSKPVLAAERLNRWCARECERSEIVDLEELNA
jgi:hypothetical protein